MSMFDWLFGPEVYGPYAQQAYQGDPYAGMQQNTCGLSQADYDAYVQAYNLNVAPSYRPDPNVIDVEARVVEERKQIALDGP